MIYKVVIEQKAIHDIEDAIDYYDHKRFGLGAIFNQIVEEYIHSISINPFYQIRYKDYHVISMKKFPFIFFYYINEEIKTVFIISVFNTYLDPGKYP